jgi:hypothetical protein
VVILAQKPKRRPKVKIYKSKKMAVWQYNLTVIPKNSIIEKYGEIPQKLFIDVESWTKYREKWNNEKVQPEIDFEDAKTILWWKNSEIDLESTTIQIDELVSRASWSEPNFLSWKSNDENDNDCHIAISEKNKIISEFIFRTDLRNKDNIELFLNGILNICKANELLLMNLEGYLFEPKMELIFEDLKKSNAIKFLSDPIKFLENISNGK